MGYSHAANYLKCLFVFLLATVFMCGCTSRFEPYRDATENLVQYLGERVVSVRARYECVIEEDEDDYDRDDLDPPKPRTTRRYFNVGGSGTIIDSWGGYSIVLTADHVVVPVREYASTMCTLHTLEVSRHDLKDNSPEEYITGKVVARNEDSDVALLRIDHDYFISTEIAPEVNIGARIHVLGFPTDPLRNQSRILSYSSGHISSVGLVRSNVKYWVKFSASVYFGSSGGGIFDNRGRILSVASFLFARWEIPINGYYYGPSVEPILDLLDSYKGTIKELPPAE